MTKQEFEELNGKKRTDEEFEVINEMYMNAGDHVTKQEFEKMYRYSGDHRLAEVLNETISELRNMLNESAKERIDFANKVADERLRLAKLLLEMSDEYCDVKLRQETVNLLGKWDAAMLAIELNLPLWNEERDFVNEVLERDRDREASKNAAKLIPA